jgi:hypothetical protein
MRQELAAVVLNLLLVACSSIGPGTVPYDRIDYGSAIGDSWKQQTLLNIVKLRYADMPIFLEVGQVIAGYQLQSAIGGSFTAGNFTAGIIGPFTAAGSANAAGTYTDRPTVIYSRLVGDLFEYRYLGDIELKGIAGLVSAWQALRTSSLASRFEALRGSALSPLVGRDEEIDLLLRRWARVKASDGQIVLVSGEPGIGKSRLVAALAERLRDEPHLRLRYFCSPYHQDSALSPFIDQLGRAAAFSPDDPPAARLEKLKALLALAAPPDDDFALIADLLSLPPSERHPLPNLSPQRKKERTLDALIRQLDGLARRQPVLMVFEDAHWIDPTSRELLDLRSASTASHAPSSLQRARPTPWQVA